MAPPKKLLILNILDILNRYTDENHRLTQREIIDILRREYDTTADRKTVRRNLDNLLEAGCDIEYSEISRCGRDGEEESILTDWYINRKFTDAELRLLIDGLLFSKHIPYSQCKALIEKLGSLSSVHFTARMKHVRSLPVNMAENKQLFYTIDILDEAIDTHKKVAFQYNEYDTDKKLRPRRGGEEYVVNPYQIVTANGRYYLIGNYDKYDNEAHYRLDRISGVRLLDERVKPMKLVQGLENGLDLPKHMAEHIYMFSGESVRVRFNASRGIVGEIIDWFGTDVMFSSVTDDECTATVTVNENAMFYWALQYGEYVEVTEPANLRARIKDAVAKINQKYMEE
jgi:predicted DNA-binding transcriptional regulator YafY